VRLVSAMQIELEPDPDRPGSSRSLIAWLDAAGNTRFARPLDKWKRIVDVEPGDWIRHRGRRFQVKGVKPYRSHAVGPECPMPRESDGFMTSLWDECHD
jgi:hypothetical protein